MVLIDTRGTGMSADQMVAALKAQGIRASARPPSTVRFVTHRHIGDAEIDALLGALLEIVDRAA